MSFTFNSDRLVASQYARDYRAQVASTAISHASSLSNDYARNGISTITLVKSGFIRNTDYCYYACDTMRVFSAEGTGQPINLPVSITFTKSDGTTHKIKDYKIERGLGGSYAICKDGKETPHHFKSLDVAIYFLIQQTQSHWKASPQSEHYLEASGLELGSRVSDEVTSQTTTTHVHSCSTGWRPEFRTTPANADLTSDSLTLHRPDIRKDLASDALKNFRLALRDKILESKPYGSVRVTTTRSHRFLREEELRELIRTELHFLWHSLDSKQVSEWEDFEDAMVDIIKDALARPDKSDALKLSTKNSTGKRVVFAVAKLIISMGGSALSAAEPAGIPGDVLSSVVSPVGQYLVSSIKDSLGMDPIEVI